MPRQVSHILPRSANQAVCLIARSELARVLARLQAHSFLLIY